jgi:hypothetical protein
MAETDTTPRPTLAELKVFIREVGKFRDFENYHRHQEAFDKTIGWLKEKARGR